jgi:hypothetical protein
MTNQGRRRRAEEPEGTPERDRSGRAAARGRAGRPKLEPMRINEAKVIWIGIGLWAAAFLILLPFRNTLISDGHGWWLYTCLAGAGLGMVGLPMVGRRKTVMARESEHGQQRGGKGPAAGRAGQASQAGQTGQASQAGQASQTKGRGRGRH